MDMGEAYLREEELCLSPKVMLSRTPNREHSQPVLHNLHWLPVEYLIRFKVLVLAFKALNSLGPTYLQDCLSNYTPRVIYTQHQEFAGGSQPERYLAVINQGYGFFCPDPYLLVRQHPHLARQRYSTWHLVEGSSYVKSGTLFFLSLQMGRY